MKRNFFDPETWVDSIVFAVFIAVLSTVFALAIETAARMVLE